MGNDQSHLATLASKISTSSAMNPGLIFCLVVTPVGLLGAISLFQFGHPIAATLMSVIAAIPVAIVAWQIVRFTLRDPDRLQRDEHVQRMFQLRSTLVVKDGSTIREFNVSNDLSGNPALEDQNAK